MSDSLLPQVEYDRAVAQRARFRGQPAEAWAANPQWRGEHDSLLHRIQTLLREHPNEIRSRPAGRVNPWPRDATGAITHCAGLHGGEFESDPDVYRFEPHYRHPGDRRPSWWAYCRFCGARCHGSGVLAPEARREEARRQKMMAGRPWRARNHAALGRGGDNDYDVTYRRYRFGGRRRRKPVETDRSPRNRNPYGRTRSHTTADGRRAAVAGRWDRVAGANPEDILTRRARLRAERPRRTTVRRVRQAAGRAVKATAAALADPNSLPHHLVRLVAEGVLIALTGYVPPPERAQEDFLWFIQSLAALDQVAGEIIGGIAQYMRGTPVNPAVPDFFAAVSAGCTNVSHRDRDTETTYEARQQADLDRTRHPRPEETAFNV